MSNDPRYKDVVHIVVKLHDHLELYTSTLFVTIRTMNRYFFCESQTSASSSCNVLACTFLSIACKIDDGCGWSRLYDYMHTNEMSARVARIEHKILERLHFRVHSVTPDSLHFLCDLCEKLHMEISNEYNLALYLLELALVHHEVSREFDAITVAAGCVLLAYCTIHWSVRRWVRNFERVANTRRKLLAPCVTRLQALHRSSYTETRAVYDKYARAQRGFVSHISHANLCRVIYF